MVLSFDVEEHSCIEAAAGLALGPALMAHCRARLAPSTDWLLEQLERYGIKATFFLVGQLVHSHAGLIRAIHRAGHEVASHGWDHQRVHNFTPARFREDLRRSKDALEQIIGEAVVGYRAPTFSIVRQTAWAIDVLAESGMLYDSSIYPVRHDRYGIPQAPRSPFLAQGPNHVILELPPAVLRLLGTNLPIGGGGYFRLLPLALIEYAIQQMRRDRRPSVAMLYFHPWDFDPRQRRLPMTPLNRFRTYIGIFRSRARLTTLLEKYHFVRAVDVAGRLDRLRHLLPSFDPVE